MNKEQFSLRVTERQGSLYRVASGYLRGEHDRLDAVSEAILKAWQKRDTLKNEAYFDTWLTRILIRECINILRKQKRMVPVESMPEDPAPQTEANGLREALDALPQKLRIVMVLHYMEGYDVMETARTLGLTKGAVCSRLSRGRSAMRVFLEEEWL